MHHIGFGPDDELIPHPETGEMVTRRAVRREFMIRSAISSLALDGIHVDRETAERIFDEVEKEPPIDMD